MSTIINEENVREELKRLDLKRQTLEAESQAITDELLTSPEGGGAPMGIDTPLVGEQYYIVAHRMST